VLLTKDVIKDKLRNENAANTFEKLLDLSIIPIVNENDVISTEQIEFGDNDTLSATVATLIPTDLLVILSDIDGLYDKNPKKEKARFCLQHQPQSSASSAEHAACRTAVLGDKTGAEIR
jgi:glutamate 5-kinase